MEFLKELCTYHKERLYLNGVKKIKHYKMCFEISDVTLHVSDVRVQLLLNITGVALPKLSLPTLKLECNLSNIQLANSK